MLTYILIGTHKKKHGSFIKELTIMQGGIKLNTESKENQRICKGALYN